MDDCRFCQIIAKKIDAYIVFEDEHCVAFLDNRPIFRGHCLLVPKKHIENVMEASDSILCSLGAASKKLSLAVKNAVSSDGILIINNNIVSQSVPHLHIHVIPRNKGDGLRGFMWPRTTYKAGEEEEFKDRIQKAVKALERNV